MRLPWLQKTYFNLVVENLVSALKKMSAEIEKAMFSDEVEELPPSADDEGTASGADDTQGERRTSTTSSALTISKDAECGAEKTDEVVFVKLYLPQGAACTLTAYASMTILDLKMKVAQELQAPHHTLVFVHAIDCPKYLEKNAELIKNLMSKKNKLELYVNSGDPDVELQVPDYLRVKPLDILTVLVDTGVPGQEPRTVVVEIEKDCQAKEFFGGFRCKKSGLEYYHAATQTPRDFPSKIIKKMSRKVQTQIINSTFEQQTSVDGATQTGGPITGRIVGARDEEKNADDVFSISDLAKIVLIQRVFRGWRVRNGIEKIRTEALLNQELQKYVQGEESAKGYNANMFEVLYRLVEKWRKRCLDYAFATKTQGPSRADFQDILEMQVNMLAIIEKERVKVREQRQQEKEKRLLEENCSPLKWKSHNGATITMETLKSQHASFLKQLHDQLFSTELDTQHLHENLISVQDQIQSQIDPAYDEVLQLIDRELQLLELGFATKDLKKLHLRLEKLFTNLICDPASHKPQKGKFFLCKQCRKMLPPKSFVIPLTRPELKLCASCHWIDNMSHKRVDHSPFATMLKEMQQFETRKGCYRSMAFVLEVHDVKYLVDQIWHGQSAISQTADLMELRLGRWDVAKEWSPWNTVLLTKRELQQHVNVCDFNSVYGEAFIRNVHIKHLIAQIHFKGLK